MKYLAVIDTNVIVSALLTDNQSKPGKILEYINKGVITPAYNEDILSEYKEVLSRNKFPFSEETIDKTLQLITSTGVELGKTEADEQMTDESDVVFYQIVLTANMVQMSYLVTGNIKHFPKRVFIVTPNEMINIIESQN